MFQVKGEKGEDVMKTASHYMYATRFLQGEYRTLPAQLSSIGLAAQVDAFTPTW